MRFQSRTRNNSQPRTVMRTKCNFKIVAAPEPSETASLGPLSLLSVGWVSLSHQVLSVASQAEVRFSLLCLAPGVSYSCLRPAWFNAEARYTHHTPSRARPVRVESDSRGSHGADRLAWFFFFFVFFPLTFPTISLCLPTYCSSRARIRTVAYFFRRQQYDLRGLQSWAHTSSSSNN